MKKLLCTLLAAAMLCGCTPARTDPPPVSVSAGDFEQKWADSGFVRIRLDDAMPSVTAPGGAPENAVTFGNDIIYYESGQDESYGEGEKGDMHTAEEAARHTVVHIHAPGTYVVTGNLSAGQIAVDLGEEAADDPAAVVTLILDNVNIVNTVAPAVIFYNVYECGDKSHPTAAVDTSAAGANVILADDSINNIVGSHVAKIYKPGTEDKLHKYDAAFYSKMSMNIGGEGCLNITADNEGLDSELHLTINSGTISIASGNDGINTNADGISVTTVNGGTLNIHVTGSTGEGDGIDSNGYIVFNGGTAINLAHPDSMDGGIDSDMGSSVNGGVIVGAGNMYDPIEADSAQLFMMLEFSESTDQLVVVTDENDVPVFAYDFPHDYMYVAFSSPALEEGKTYRVYLGGEIEGEARNGLYESIVRYTPGVRMQHGAGSAQQRGFAMPDGMQPPEGADFGNPPELPDGMDFGDMPKPPEGGRGFSPFGMESSADVATADFILTRESTGFTNVSAMQAE